ncbi:hypothetical protein ACFZAD_23065 [Streptomyces iakyrus]|uniref:hypothetical protein n=1 Tax=Streptomyces iakyrus TaxID=68219 RepID=UPI0036E9605C
MPEPWEPWDEGDWNRIAGLPHADEWLIEAQRVITALLEDPELSPPVPEPPSPACCGTCGRSSTKPWERMPRPSQVTWSGADELVRAWRDRPQPHPLQRHVPVAGRAAQA